MIHMVNEHMMLKSKDYVFSLRLEQDLIVIGGIVLAIFGVSVMIKSRAIRRVKSPLITLSTYILMGITAGLSGALTTLTQSAFGGAFGPLAGLLLGGSVGGVVGACVDGASQIITTLSSPHLRKFGLVCCALGVLIAICQAVILLIAPALP